MRFIQSLWTRGKGTKIYNRLTRSLIIELSLSLTTVAPSKMLIDKRMSQMVRYSRFFYLSAPKRAARSLKLICRFIFSWKQNSYINFLARFLKDKDMVVNCVEILHDSIDFGFLALIPILIDFHKSKKITSSSLFRSSCSSLISSANLLPLDTSAIW